MPSGSYRVTILAGDPSYSDGYFDLDVEGEQVVKGEPSGGDRWLSGSKTIDVTDGRLTVTNGSDADNNKINYIQVERVDDASASGGGSTGSGLQRINFQSTDAYVPGGYVADYGDTYGDRGNGRSFGWNADNTDSARNRDDDRSPDQEYDTLTHLQRGGEYRWEIAVPDGSYRVKIVAGDPSYFDGYFDLDVEGIEVVKSNPSSGTRWVSGTKTLNVTDGRLTVTNGSAASNNKINFIEFERLGAVTGETGSNTSDRPSEGGTAAPNDGSSSPSEPSTGKKPTARINLMDATILPGQAVHVDALNSTLRSGTPLTARYEWDFGDGGSKYNKLVGFNASHVYDRAGTYTLKLKVFNADGRSPHDQPADHGGQRYAPRDLRLRRRQRLQRRPLDQPADPQLEQGPQPRRGRRRHDRPLQARRPLSPPATPSTSSRRTSRWAPTAAAAGRSSGTRGRRTAARWSAPAAGPRTRSCRTWSSTRSTTAPTRPAPACPTASHPTARTSSCATSCSATSPTW